jgi:hypothetical protein
VPGAALLDRAIDTSSPEKAILSAARWVKATRPEFLPVDDRQVCFEMMTEVIGALRPRL